ncbi:MAG: trigger factor [Gammaproteobacteria bacterium]|uniref:Trigger factor n=1 Tax=SAR86 cluster bacterium TaxID=2030880 RepID=A0A368BLK3_9GAMM|nr:MAG: trigger factor [SAR86 cluster bacterium]|tara:strand:- start:817 stop:2118 length:1302 start_codon:yes stop_codon:yes gene_type:complete
MSSKIKKLKDLERKLTVSVPVEDYDKKYGSKLSKIKSTAKLDGFRKGNVPDDVLRQRYGDSIHYEVLNELIQESYPKELQEQDIKPASSPAINIESEEPTKPISYSAVFEVFPEIKPKISRWKSFEKSEITLDDSDIDLAINDISERYCVWNKVDREAAKDDQVIIDFEGKIDGDPFEGNESKDFKLILGSKSMIPGFEDNLVGKKSKESFSFRTNFPEDYFKKDLAGKETEFFITLHEVQEMKKAAIDKELFEKLAMEDVTDEQTFRAEIKKRMDGEISQQEKSLTKESIYETLLQSNDFKVPNATVNEQAELMRKDSLMRMGQTVENAADDLFPVEDFLENAKKRVRLDLLFSALVQKYELEIKEDDLNHFIDDEAQKYKDAEQFKSWIQSQPQQLDQYRMVILENLLIEKLDSALKSKVKVIKFSDLANK